MNFYTWALKWGIPAEAIADLTRQLGYESAGLQDIHVTSEDTASKHVRLAAAKGGDILWRNNVGAVMTEDGRMVRYGLCNDSKQLNEKFKSSDLIGIRPVNITNDMVGSTIGQFIAREVKKPGWNYKGTSREQAQQKFLTLVATSGGDAQFTTGEY